MKWLIIWGFIGTGLAFAQDDLGQLRCSIQHAPDSAVPPYDLLVINEKRKDTLKFHSELSETTVSLAAGSYEVVFLSGSQEIHTVGIIVNAKSMTFIYIDQVANLNAMRNARKKRKDK